MATVVGQRVRRREDPRFLLGQGRYVDDLPPRGDLHVTFVRADWAHARIGEIDTEEASSDAGPIINPLVAEGQVHGGLAAGIAQALYEEMRYDEDGNPQQANLVTYCFPTATELPCFELSEMAAPTPINPLGAKGIGESGTIGATPAVHNAVIDALSPFGVRHIDMPVNGESVWRAIQNARGSS